MLLLHSQANYSVEVSCVSRGRCVSSSNKMWYACINLYTCIFYIHIGITMKYLRVVERRPESLRVSHVHQLVDANRHSVRLSLSRSFALSPSNFLFIAFYLRRQSASPDESCALKILSSNLREEKTWWREEMSFESNFEFLWRIFSRVLDWVSNENPLHYLSGFSLWNRKRFCGSVFFFDISRKGGFLALVHEHTHVFSTDPILAYSARVFKQRDRSRFRKAAALSRGKAWGTAKVASLFFHSKQRCTRDSSSTKAQSRSSIPTPLEQSMCTPRIHPHSQHFTNSWKARPRRVHTLERRRGF